MNNAVLAVSLTRLTEELKKYYSDAEDVEKVILQHAVSSAAAGLASGWIPAGGATIATIASLGITWSMYVRINKTLGISISKNKLKSLASGILTNLAGNATGYVLSILAATALSFIPGVGSAASAVISAAIDFALICVAGAIYIAMLTKLFRADEDIANISDEQLKTFANNVYAQDKEEFDGMFKDAVKYAKEEIRKGNISKNDTIEMESDSYDLNE